MNAVGTPLVWSLVHDLHIVRTPRKLKHKIFFARKYFVWSCMLYTLCEMLMPAYVCLVTAMLLQNRLNIGSYFLFCLQNNPNPLPRTANDMFCTATSYFIFLYSVFELVSIVRHKKTHLLYVWLPSKCIFGDLIQISPRSLNPLTHVRTGDN